MRCLPAMAWVCTILLAVPAAAEWAVEAPLPPSLQHLVPAGDRNVTFYPFPASSLALLAANNEQQRCELTLLRRREDGAYEILGRQDSEHDWAIAYSLQVLPSEGDRAYELAIANEGSDINILVYDKGLRAPAQEFSFWAGPGASPWSAPGYGLRQHGGKLVVVQTWDSMGDELPDGSHLSESSDGPAVMRWEGEGFVALPAEDVEE